MQRAKNLCRHWSNTGSNLSPPSYISASRPSLWWQGFSSLGNVKSAIALCTRKKTHISTSCIHARTTRHFLSSPFHRDNAWHDNCAQRFFSAQKSKHELDWMNLSPGGWELLVLVLLLFFFVKQVDVWPCLWLLPPCSTLADWCTK